jgi:hypothetical protein
LSIFFPPSYLSCQRTTTLEEEPTQNMDVDEQITLTQ